MPSVYNVKDGDTIFDVAIATYGSLNQVYKLLQDNPAVESIDVELDQTEFDEPIVFQFDETFVAPESQEERQVPRSFVLSDYAVSDSQTIFDIALMLYGNVERVYQIIQENINLIRYIHQFIPNGTVLYYNKDYIDDMALTDYIEKNKIIISTLDPDINRGSAWDVGFVIESYY